MASGKKIADGAAKMSSSPIIGWIRSILLRTHRVSKEGKTIRPDFINQQRFPADQSARTQPQPNVPGGIHHRLAQNYYLDHDARRAVEPPKVLSDDGKILIAAAEQQKWATVVGPQVALGPAQNFGLPARVPTPGLGHEWTRNQADEMPTQQEDDEFPPLQRYDAYRR